MSTSDIRAYSVNHIHSRFALYGAKNGKKQVPEVLPVPVVVLPCFEKENFNQPV